jgi:hypothetical protein
VQLENNIVKEKDKQSTAKKVHGTSPKWISNMRSFGEMDIIARHSENEIRNKLAQQGNTVMFVGYLNINEKDVYQFMNIATKKTMFSREVIWLNKTYSKHLGISQVYFITSLLEEEEVEEEQLFELEVEAHVGPVTEDDNIEPLIGVPDTS